MLSIYLKTPQNYSNKVIIINSTPPSSQIPTINVIPSWFF